MIKKISSILLVSLAFCTAAFAADVAPALVIPDWAGAVLSYLTTAFPVVGLYLAKAVIWFGVLSGVLTAIAAFLDALSLSLQGVFNFAGFTKVSEFIAKAMSYIGPVVKFLSAYNVQKKI